MSYDRPGFGFEVDDDPLASAFGVPGYDSIPDSFAGADELGEIVWRKGPVAKQFVPPSAFSADMSRGYNVDERGTRAASRLEPAAPQLFIGEDEMASWLCLPQDVTGGGQNADPLTELGRQSAAPAAEGFSRAEAARRRESTEVGSSATPEVERAPPAVSRPITDVGSKRTPWACEDRAAAAATASSSGDGGGECRTMHAMDERKRKVHDSDDSEGEDAEYDSESKSKAHSRSKKRTRSAEVHNLSERRRRDRINEKMKTLQQLIPQCSKTDKASMLDDAVEYMKSLQLQIQMMRGMAPMTFPCIPQHASQMGMTINGMRMEANLGNFIPKVWPFPPFMMGSAISIPTSLQSPATISMPAYFPAMLAVNGQLPYRPAVQQDPNLINFQSLNPALRPAVADPYHQFLGQQMQIPHQNYTSAEQGGNGGPNPIKIENPEHGGY